MNERGAPFAVAGWRGGEVLGLGGSSAGKAVLASQSDHEIFLYQPDLVFKAIRDVVRSARRR